MEFVPGQRLSEICPKDKPWDAHRAENVQVAGLYAEEVKFARLASRMEDCSKFLVFGEKIQDDVEEHDNRLKLVKARFCRVRHCPICAWRKSLALKARFLKNLPDYLDELNKLSFLHVVLTVRNPPIHELKNTIKAMNDALKKMFKREQLLGVVHGFIKSIEVTKGQDGNPHPHFHIILAVGKRYFKGEGYLSKPKWVALWRDCLGVDYDPSVNVKRIKQKLGKGEIPAGCESAADLIAGVVEVVKYGVKPADIVLDKDFLYGVTEQVKGMRFLEAGGCFRGIFKNHKNPNEDEVSDDELMLKNENGDHIGQDRFVFIWQRSEYVFLHSFTEEQRE